MITVGVPQIDLNPNLSSCLPDLSQFIVYLPTEDKPQESQRLHIHVSQIAHLDLDQPEMANVEHLKAAITGKKVIVFTSENEPQQSTRSTLALAILGRENEVVLYFKYGNTVKKGEMEKEHVCIDLGEVNRNEKKWVKKACDIENHVTDKKWAATVQERKLLHYLNISQSQKLPFKLDPFNYPKLPPIPSEKSSSKDTL